MKKKKLGTRITIMILAVLAYGIFAAGLTGMICLASQGEADMKTAMTERASSAANLVRAAIGHYESLTAALDGTSEQSSRIEKLDEAIIAIDLNSSSPKGLSVSNDGCITFTGEYNGGTASVKTDPEWLKSIISSMMTSESSELYILNSGNKIVTGINATLPAEELAKFSSNGEVKTMKLGGKNKVIYEAPLEGTQWRVLAVCDESDFKGRQTTAMIFLIINDILCFAVGTFIIRRFVKRVTVPVEDIGKKIIDISQGKLSGRPVEVTTGDELQTLAEAVNTMSEYTENIIGDIKNVSVQIAAENLTVKPAMNYVGDYAPIKTALDGIIGSVSSVIRQIEASGRMVADGSARMSDNSNTLSAAAAEQETTVRELNNSVVEISSNITANAENAARAKKLADDCRKKVDEGSMKMSDMLGAMEEINEASSKIANIIKAIQDISFQTNILSLNASIEAARAGEAGKGFAVVAGEVGQLAGKTAEAAKNTTDLINRALSAVENGTVMANETAKMLDKIVSETDDTANVVEQIASASEVQAESVKQILVGMDQISSSVKMTSGSSAECASSAEEISEQARVLHELVKRFKVGSPEKPSAPKPTAPKPAPKYEEQPKPAPKPASKPIQNTTPAKSFEPVFTQSSTPAVSHNDTAEISERPARSKTIVLDDDKY